MLPTLELAQMRTELARSLPDTCNLLTPTNVSDGQGGFTQTWGTALASVGCRFDAFPRYAREILAANAVMPYEKMMVTLAFDTVITSDYRIEHGGFTYNVTGVNIDQSWPICKRADVEKVNL